MLYTFPMSDKMTQAIEKAYANMGNAIIVEKDASVTYGQVWFMTADTVTILSHEGFTAVVKLSDIKSFARCDNRYTV